MVGAFGFVLIIQIWDQKGLFTVYSNPSTTKSAIKGVFNPDIPPGNLFLQIYMQPVIQAEKHESVPHAMPLSTILIPS